MNALLEYNGRPIREREEMLSLTDMWHAAKAEEAKRPVHWQRSGPGQEFIEFITATFKLKQDYVWQARRGKHGGGTWAHWQIAFAYAKFLSPSTHAYCNTIVHDHMERMREARLPLPALAIKSVLGRA